jgi:hypothetical protein
VIPALLLALGATASTAQTTLSLTLPCVSQRDAEAIVTSVLPDVIQNVGELCVNTLPRNALLRQDAGPFIAKYRAQADLAWPHVEGNLRRMLGDSGGGFLAGSPFARPLLGTVLAPLLTRSIQPGDCPQIERIIELIEPLPPANAAPLFVEVLQFADSKRKDKGAKPALPICQPGAK